MNVKQLCEICKGTGLYKNKKCSWCWGEGYHYLEGIEDDRSMLEKIDCILLKWGWLLLVPSLIILWLMLK